ncbi:MAG: uncharacterized protein JWN32_4402, partial [Solirubrobacterales bacterium]|nr:uncharacterized protein [Solirubrobacterales bacterium]
MAQAPHQHIQRASRGILAVARGQTRAHEHLRNRLLAIVWITIALDALCTLIVFLTERHASGTQIHDVWDAFLFSTAQLLTASSVASPATDVGKVLELFFDVYAITVVATLAGSFGAFFHRLSQEHEEKCRAEEAARAAAAAEAQAP